jgi:hypothetical protein
MVLDRPSRLDRAPGGGNPHLSNNFNINLSLSLNIVIVLGDHPSRHPNIPVE